MNRRIEIKKEGNEISVSVPDELNVRFNDEMQGALQKGAVSSLSMLKEIAEKINKEADDYEKTRK